jgi:[ribosomal protein S18]-alanine N-acetyltransferase
MSKIECVPLTKDHLLQVYEIECVSFHSPWSIDALNQELLNPTARYVVAIKDKKVIGFGGMWLILDEAHITNIAVHPAYRNLKIGSLILESLIQIGEEEGILSMTLEVRVSNINAQRLYGKYNFIVAGRRKAFYQDNKEDCLIMWRK